MFMVALNRPRTLYKPPFIAPSLYTDKTDTPKHTLNVAVAEGNNYRLWPHFSPVYSIVGL